MRKHLTEIGNSLGIALPSEIIKLLNLSKENEVDITTNGSNKIFLEIIREGQQSIKVNIDINLNVHINTIPP